MENIGIIGVGRLGICMALCFERTGYNVYCVDKNDDVMTSINERKIISHEPGVVAMLANASNIHATSTKELLDKCDIFFVVVPTPTMPNNEYDHTYIEEVVATFAPQKTRKTMVVSCTVMPGYCSDLAKRLDGLCIDVCYNPEFIAQGDIVNGFENPDIVLIGAMKQQVAERVASVYKKLCKNEPSYCLMELTEAEITKVSLNCYITMKIAYANMIGDLVRSAGGTPQVVLDAISKDSRVGTKCMKYGYGYGGPCFPRDNLALQAYANKNNMKMLLSQATDAANKYHLEMMINAHKKDNTSFEFSHVTYKPESVIIEKSFALDLAVALAREGCSVHINERNCVVDDVKKLYGDIFTYSVRE